MFPVIGVGNNKGIDRGEAGGGSIVFDGTDDDLTWTSGTPTDNDKWTVSCWVKGGHLSSLTILEGWTGSTNDRTLLAYSGTSGSFRLFHRDTSLQFDFVSDQVFRGPGNWYHFVCSYDAAQATDSDRIRMWVDNVALTDAGPSWPALNKATDINGSSNTHTIGGSSAGTVHDDGYLYDYHFFDGKSEQSGDAVAPSNFGKVSADTGRWVRKAYDGGEAYGTNGFNLTFDSADSDTTTVTDNSANSNNWTANGYSSDVTTNGYTNDTPDDNACTWNPLSSEPNITLGNGNRTASFPTTGSVDRAFSTMRLPNSGKWYFEIQKTENNTGPIDVGITREYENNVTLNANDFVMSIRQDNAGSYGSFYNGASGFGSNLCDPSNNDIFGFAVDMDNRTVFVAQNNTYLNSGDPVAGTGNVGSSVPDDVIICAIDRSSSAFTVNLFCEDNDLNYSPPTGYKTLTSANLPVPSAAYRKPQNFADILLYTGDGVAIGSGGNSVTGANFTPDFAWIKNRDAADNHHVYDLVRGATNRLLITTGVEIVLSEGLNSFDSGGFTVGSDVEVNTNTEDYWSLVLKAGGAAASNTDGSINSTVSVGDFFSCGTYTGNATAGATIGHGLGRVPDMIIIKERTNDGGGWFTYHSANTSAPETDYLQIDTTAATADLNTIFNDTAPTSSVFSVGNNDDVNGSTDTYVFYAFVFDTTDADSPFTGGSYLGNGSTDGTFIPSDGLLMFMTKRTDSANSWTIQDTLRDTSNPIDNYILADTSGAESASGLSIDLISNGAKWRTTSAAVNASGGTYIWFGIKENGQQLWA